MALGRMREVALVVLAVALCAPVAAQKPQLGYYRHPAIWNDTIVFVAEGDLWRVGISGGVAQRLTSHPEEESRPAVSPDGKTMAFAASYEGPGEVYTLPLDGGPPARQTWDASTSRLALVDTAGGGPLLDTQTLDPAKPPARTPGPEVRVRTHRALAQASDGAFDAPGRCSSRGWHSRAVIPAATRGEPPRTCGASPGPAGGHRR